jgi:citrate lyase subunit beta / citryl-CoA lyase
MTGPVWLFVPGDRPERFAKAVASGADHVVCDLEDGVAPSAKDEARTRVASWLDEDGGAWVRVNGRGSPWHADDLAAVARARGLHGLIVPKVESSDDVAAVAAAVPGRPILAIIESAVGVAAVDVIAEVPAVERLVHGSVDLSLDLDASPDSETMAYTRARIVVASTAAGKAGPVAGVSTAIRDPSAVEADARRDRGEGFAGKLAIHPSQIDPIRRAFEPSADDLGWARAVLETSASAEHGAVQVAGQMVDAPVVARARRILGLEAPVDPSHDRTRAERRG